MMTLEEAIKHCKDVALSCTNKECALEHFQLLKWLQEYSNMLEKQGEPVEINPTEFDTRLQTLIEKFANLPKEELIGSLSFWLNVVQNGTYNPTEKQGEQKPTDNVIETWKDMRLEVYQQASGNRHEPNCSDDTTKMFSINDIDEIIEKISEQKPVDKVEPQPKQEWSEEDERMIKVLNSIIRYIIEIVDKDALERFGTNREELFSWLKSLSYKIGTQKHWKPSDKQMKTLNKVIFCTYNANNIEDKKHIESLYNNLKKLTE